MSVEMGRRRQIMRRFLRVNAQIWRNSRFMVGGGCEDEMARPCRFEAVVARLKVLSF
jgi:hypothetical protein